jgi:hypothetical protein
MSQDIAALQTERDAIAARIAKLDEIIDAIGEAMFQHDEESPEWATLQDRIGREVANYKELSDRLDEIAAKIAALTQKGARTLRRKFGFFRGPQRAPERPPGYSVSAELDLIRQEIATLEGIEDTIQGMRARSLMEDVSFGIRRTIDSMRRSEARLEAEQTGTSADRRPRERKGAHGVYK